MKTRLRWLPLLALLALLHTQPTSADAEAIEPGSAEAAASAEASAPEEFEPVNLIELAKERRKRSSFYPISNRVSRYLAAASEAMAEDDNDGATSLLERLNPERLNPYERAYVFRLMAYAYYTTAEYAAAIEYFDKVLDQEAVSVTDEARVRFNIVQLNAALQDWREVVRTTNVWFHFAFEPNPLAFYLLAIAHYQLEEIEDAIIYAGTAIDLSPEPQESWLQLLAALYVQNQDYASAAPVFEELVMRFPKKQYWVQLSLIYGARDNFRHSLAVQQIAYLQGFLTKDDELRRFARSYLYASLPHQAALILDEGLRDGSIDPESDAYTLLANSWIQAREFERSLEPLMKAALLADNGNLYVRLGQVHMQREEWPAAVNLLHQAIDKGGLDSPGMAQLLLGISYYNNDRVDSARSSFAHARKHEKTRKQASDWIAHIDNESRSG